MSTTGSEVEAAFAGQLPDPGAAPAGGSPRLVLDRTPPSTGAAPALDAEQQQVVAHRAGPMLVLAGPGTGKTTTLVEAMVARLEGPDALRADQVLGLTFGRKAAQEWRERVTARIGGGLSPTVSTFHSFAYALVREQADPEAYLEPLRLLSGPEQELRLRELLSGAVRDGRVAWPDDLAPALGTRGLAGEVRAVVAKARALGLDPTDLTALAPHAGALGPAWRAVGEFLGDYLDVLDAEGVTDYTEIVHRAALLAHDPVVQPTLRDRFRAVYVDEFQDTDPAQVRLLRGLVGPETTFVVVGDPDQSIYTFRGADPGGILGFRDAFPSAEGGPAPTVVLRSTRRFGPVVRDAAARVLRTASLAPLPADIQRLHRSPVCEGAAYGDGTVEVRTFDSESAEAGHIADTLRRAHLEQGVPWNEMAVLVRSGRRSVPPLRRALTAAGVPVEVAADELPLHEEAAVAPLLTLLGVVVDAGALDDETTRELLLSPLADADPADLRRLGRALRRVEREEDPECRPTPSATLIRELVELLAADPKAVLPISTASSGRDARARHALTAVRRLARLLHDARAVVEAQGSAEAVLWSVWSGTASRGGSGWPQRLEAAALRGGDAGRRADADLDAVLALFAAAERIEERYAGRRGVTNFLAELREQQIPADTLAEKGVRGPAVRLLTAHRAKGLQWRLVVVAVGAGRRVAGRPPARLAAAARPARDQRPGRRPAARGAARRGAPAVLRRLHARPGAPRRHRRAIRARRRGAALALPRRRPRPRARPRRPPARPPPAPAVRARPRRAAAVHRRRPVAPGRAARRGHAAPRRARRCHRRRRAPARRRPPTRRAGGGCSTPRRRRCRCVRPTTRSRSPAASSAR